MINVNEINYQLVITNDDFTTSAFLTVEDFKGEEINGYNAFWAAMGQEKGTDLCLYMGNTFNIKLICRMERIISVVICDEPVLVGSGSEKLSKRLKAYSQPTALRTSLRSTEDVVKGDALLEYGEMTDVIHHSGNLKY